MREALIFRAVALTPSYYQVLTEKLSDAIFRHIIFNLRDGSRQTIYDFSDTEEIEQLSSLSLHTPEEIENFEQYPVFVEHCKFLRSDDCLSQRRFMPHTTEHIQVESERVLTSIIEVQTYTIETMQEKESVISKVVINDGFDVRYERVFDHNNTQHLMAAHIEAVTKANKCFPLLMSVAVDTGSSSSLKTRSEENFDLVIKKITNETNEIPNLTSLRTVRLSNSGRERTPLERRSNSGLEETPLHRQYQRLNNTETETPTTQSLYQLLQSYPFHATLDKRMQQSKRISRALEENESIELDDLKLQLKYLLTRTRS